MEKNIIEKQNLNLVNEISNIVLKFKNNEFVDCIYFTPYLNKKNDSNIKIFELVIVFNNWNEENKFNHEFILLNIRYSKENKNYGGVILLDTDRSEKYVAVQISNTELARINELYNSTILFDRTGKLTKLKENASKKKDGRFIYDYTNKLEDTNNLIKKIK